MRNVSPRIEGAEEYTIAENQLEYSPVVACRVQFNGGKVHRVLRYTFTDEERERIAAGEDLYFGTPASLMLIPHWFLVGFPQ